MATQPLSIFATIARSIRWRLPAVLLLAALLSAATLIAPSASQAQLLVPSCSSGITDGGIGVNWRSIPEEVKRVHIRRDGKWLRTAEGGFEPDAPGTTRGYMIDHLYPKMGRFEYALRYRLDGELVELDCGVAQTIQDFIGECQVARNEDGTATIRIDLASSEIDRYHIRAVGGAWQHTLDARMVGFDGLVWTDDTPEEEYLVRFRAGQITERFDDVFENLCREIQQIGE